MSIVTASKFSTLTAQQKADMRDQIRGYKVFAAAINMSGGTGQISINNIYENTLDFVPTFYNGGAIKITNLPARYQTNHDKWVFLGQSAGSFNGSSFNSSTSPFRIAKRYSGSTWELFFYGDDFSYSYFEIREYL
jgi:hypothetical protein